MDHEIASYETSREKCECGETCFAERVSRLAVSCGQRLAFGSFPEIIVRPADIPAQALVRLNDVIEWASGCKLFVEVVDGPPLDSGREEIRQWVDVNYVADDEFAIGESPSFWACHADRVVWAPRRPRERAPRVKQHV
jgi:hypothetical protein